MYSLLHKEPRTCSKSVCTLHLEKYIHIRWGYDYQQLERTPFAVLACRIKGFNDYSAIGTTAKFHKDLLVSFLGSIKVLIDVLKKWMMDNRITAGSPINR